MLQEALLRAPIDKSYMIFFFSNRVTNSFSNLSLEVRLNDSFRIFVISLFMDVLFVRALRLIFLCRVGDNRSTNLTCSSSAIELISLCRQKVMIHARASHWGRRDATLISKQRRNQWDPQDSTKNQANVAGKDVSFALQLSNSEARPTTLQKGDIKARFAT